MVEEEGSLGKWFWSWEPKEEDRPDKITKAVATTPNDAVSTALSKALKKRGWSFVGPTTCYAFMQAMGMMNDHIEGCHYRSRVDEARRTFKRPV